MPLPDVAQTLAAALAAADIGYVPFPDLGGRRQPRPDSCNDGWRNASFRGYADYMESAAYREAKTRLCALAARSRTAVLCAEALWWQCHRRLRATCKRLLEHRATAADRALKRTARVRLDWSCVHCASRIFMLDGTRDAGAKREHQEGDAAGAQPVLRRRPC